MKLNHHILSLIAIGASVTANCPPCLEHTIGTALECGADKQEITEAIEIGKQVRQGALARMDQFVSHLNRSASSEATATENRCECFS